MATVSRLRVRNVELVAARLQNTGKVTNSTTREVIRKGAYDIRNLARELAPHDEGSLEDAIEVSERADPVTQRKGFTVGIINPNAPGTRAQSVSQYADEMENNWGSYKPGKGTLAKRAAGQKAGGRFLARSAIALAPLILRRVRAAIARAIARQSAKS